MNKIFFFGVILFFTISCLFVLKPFPKQTVVNTPISVNQDFFMIKPTSVQQNVKTPISIIQSFFTAKPVLTEADLKDSAPIIHSSLSSQDILLPFNDFQWQLNDLAIQNQKKKKYRKTAAQNNNDTGLWKYISVGQCDANPLSPAYLEQRMQKNTSDKRSLPVGNVDCGLIRTNIPFSF